MIWRFFNYMKFKFSLNIFSKALFLISIFGILLINIINLGNPILDEHAFRQTQTALTSYYIKQDGFKFSYETPVVGEPWSIPFEFPLYQLIVARLSKTFNYPLTNTGKLVSLLFTLLSCFPLFFLLKKLNINKNAIFFSLMLFLSSPLYLFWSGTFMIETLALFFTLNFLYFGVLIYKGNFQFLNFFFYFVFLTLALLQKITTAIIPLFLLCLIFLILITKIKNVLVRKRLLIKLFISTALPVSIAFLWVKYTDFIKQKNIIGASFTSDALFEWNYGSIEQRYSMALWFHTIFKRNISQSSFLVLGCVGVFLGFFLIKEREIKFVILIMLLLFLLPFFIFTNLHIVHSYYQLANSIFWSVSVGISIFYLIRFFPKYENILYVLLFSFFLFSNYFFFTKSYLQPKELKISEENSRTLRISNFIKKNTNENQPIVIYGYGWSSEVAFYSERRALSLPEDKWYLQAINNTDEFLSKDRPSSFVLCPVPNQDQIRLAINTKFLNLQMTKIDDCEIFLIPTK